MAHKKKYLTGSYILLLILFVLLLGASSTCYALTPSNNLDVETANNLFTKLRELGSINFGSNYNDLSSFLNNVNVEDFVSIWNSTIDISKFPTLEQMVISLKGGTIYILQNNNTYDDNLPYIKLQEVNAGSYINYSSYYINYNGNYTSGYYYILTYYTTGAFSFSLQSLSSGSGGFVGNLKSGNLITPYNNGTQTGYIVPSIITFSPSSIFLNKIGDSTFNWSWTYNIADIYIEPTPDIPSGEISNTGTITNNSGDTTGKIDLSGIENGINNINDSVNTQGQNIVNIISGESQKLINTLTEVPDLSGETISSEQISENIDFGLITNNSTLNGYTNFWLTLTNGLRGALTGNVRSIDITFRGETYTISLDNFSIQLPQQLKFILGMVSTIYFVILIVKWWKIIIDKITGGDIDEVLAMNEEERNYRFILGGV